MHHRPVVAFVTAWPFSRYRTFANSSTDPPTWYDGGYDSLCIFARYCQHHVPSPLMDAVDVHRQLRVVVALDVAAEREQRHARAADAAQRPGPGDSLHCAGRRRGSTHHRRSQFAVNCC